MPLNHLVLKARAIALVAKMLVSCAYALHRLSSSMRNLLAGERSKWIFVIGVCAIGVGSIAKNMILYPTECVPEKGLELTQLIRPLV